MRQPMAPYGLLSRRLGARSAPRLQTWIGKRREWVEPCALTLALSSLAARAIGKAEGPTTLGGANTD